GQGAGPVLVQLRLVLDGCLDRLVQVEKPRCVGGPGNRGCAGIRRGGLCTGSPRKERKKEGQEGPSEHGPLMLQSGQICTFFLGRGHRPEGRHPANGNVVVASIVVSCMSGMTAMTR